MRRLFFAWLIVTLAVPAAGARRVTVAQLDELLVTNEASHRTDLEAARQICEMEMTERLTERTLDRFAAIRHFGPRTALALQLLSDRSSFLDPPAGELPSTEAPDAAAQQLMLETARAYSAEAWARLPNFFVTRVTNRFDDNLHVFAKGDWPTDLKLQPAGSSTRQITFRDGKEVDDPTPENTVAKKIQPEEVGLRSWGEFGAALTVVMADMANHTIAFHHWEQTAHGLVAVFHYEVPKEASHYAVVSGRGSETVIGRTQFGYSGSNRSVQQVANIPRENTYRQITEFPAYHGSLSIDPATGAAMRLTIVTELSRDNSLVSAETMVQYAPITIGDRPFICPVRSLAISVARVAAGAGTESPMALNGVGDTSVWGGSVARPGKTTTLLINETSFINYHRLGSTARILTDSASNGTPTSRPASTPATTPSALAPQAPSTVEMGTAATNSRSLPPATETIASATTPLAPAEAPPPSEPMVPEVSMSAATGVPDQPAETPQVGGDEYSFKVTSRLVDVGLVAYDKKGHPVADLKPNDLELYDNGHKQEIRSFSLATNAPQPPAQATATGDTTTSETPEITFANRAPDVSAAAAPDPTSEVGSTILAIDESHIAWSDMNYARGQILKFLNSLGPGERVGIYAMNGIGFRVLVEVTSDHNALIAQMKKFMPSAQSVSAAQEEETRNRQHFDDVHNSADLNSVNGNHTDVPDADQPVDPQLLTMGDNPARASFIILGQVARHLSSLPGHKKLVWVSSDNVLADWQDQSAGPDKGPRDATVYAVRAQEAMNEAHAAVYPFDVSQLESGGVSADLEHQNVQLTPASAEAANLGGASASARDTGPGHINAAMSQDLHPVQGPVRQVAAATGGRVIRRTGDLNAQLDGIVADGHATYMLSFSPQGPADDQYHTITIKTSGRRGLTLSYRTGYLFAKEPSTLKERFQQAVWRPADVSEIAVSASVSRETAGASVKLNIAASDLGLRQQADRWMDKLDIFFIRRDDAGLHALLEGQTLGLRLKTATFGRLMSGGVPFEHFVDAKPGMASLRVLVVDENSGRMGSITIPASAIESAQ
jgi:VWFA-related protein